MKIKRTVTYKGKTYTVNANTATVPDLSAMDSISAVFWINRNTKPVGKLKPEHPLAGFAGSGITLK